MMKAICKKAFVGILSGVVLCAAIPVADTLELSNTTLTASAIGSRDYTIGDLTFTMYCPDGMSIVPENALRMEVTDCVDTAVSVTIPSEVYGVPVTAISNKAFADCTNLTQIEIPDSVMDIFAHSFDNTPFYENQNPENTPVIINGILVSMPETASTDIVIPEGVKTVSSGAIADKVHLTGVTLPDSVTRIGRAAFYCATELTKITLPPYLESIGEDAFYNCDRLTGIDLPNTVCSIEESAFDGCLSLTEADIPEGVTEIAKSAFLNTGLTRLTLPDTLTKIGAYAFQHCDDLTAVQLPESLQELGDYAFYSCDALAELNLPDALTEFGICAFQETAWLTATQAETPLLVHNGIAVDGSACVGAVTFPPDVTKIADGAFKNNTAIVSVTLPEHLELLGDSAFAGCSQLKSISIPADVTTFGTDIFASCTGLEQVTLPKNGMPVIPEGMFYNCTGLKKITIPEGVTVMEHDALESCRNLEQVSLPKSLTTVKHYVFSGCDALSTVLYNGTEDQWREIDIWWSTNSKLEQANLYFRHFGDVNLDGTVDITDLVLLSKAQLGVVSLNGVSAANGDGNDDGIADISDILLLLLLLESET